MQTLMVVLIVAAAGGYLFWYWMPARWRRNMAARVAGRSPRLADTLASKPGCGACADCNACHSRAPDSKAVASAEVDLPQKPN